MVLNSNSDNSQIILATGGYDHTIKIWQTHTGICQRTMQHAESQVNALEITPNKQLLAATGYQRIRMYDLTSNNPNPVINYEGLSKNVTSVGFQEDCKWMFTGGEDCSARIWDYRAKTHRNAAKIFQTSAPVTSVCLHPNQVELLVADQSGVLHLWDLRTDHNEQFIPDGETMILDVDVDASGNFMAAVNSKGRCYIWSLTPAKDGEPSKTSPKTKFDAHKRHALKCKFSPDSNLLVTTSSDQTARIWKTSDFSLQQELKHDNQRWVWDAAFSSDSQYVFTASSDGYAKLWNVKTGAMEREYAGHQKAVITMAFKDAAV
ncbi:target of rapamycin complex subunit lst8 [Agrilus planipennis]|uniref:Target of rapamycin complex subunit lst8 n=1 Tax=Agrilus planipennis TaxID=224129 RepID=A0A1W4WXM4_AGRPL|nr:target of rapamycin complex subunit lst8 [Agrilus planipennis]